MEEEDERSVELSSIAAIFPELIVDPANSFAATLDVPVTPEKPLKIYFQSSAQTVPVSSVNNQNGIPSAKEDGADAAVHRPLVAALNIDTHQLSHLPPLKLHIELPNGYPQRSPPNVTIRSEPVWLPQQILDRLRDQCTDLWKECGQDQVVYTFIDHVQQEAEKAFGLADGTQNKFQLSSDLKLVLLDYDLKRKQEQFENETFECGICLDPKKGRICHRLMLCGHVFCVACLQDFYNNCISEGDVDSVKCLDPGCGKELNANVTPSKRRKTDHTLNPSELLQIPIEQELVQRYVHLKRKKRIEADKNTVYCPRQWCQGAARSKKYPKLSDPLQDAADESEYESEHEQDAKSVKKKKKDPNEIPMIERLSICEDCNYAFCSVCKKGWHGERANCNPRRQAELNAEEQASLEYMKKFSTPCPTCSAPAQKAYGCNHMICFKCKTHFCYLCSAYLMPDNPYKHFNDPKGTCYMRLWELEGGDGAADGVEVGGGMPPPWEAEDLDSEDSEDEDAEPAVGVVEAWDADTDDEEPAPDQRRPARPHIEIVNFAGNGVNRQIALPNDEARPAAAGLPVAPARNARQGAVPPRGRGNRPQRPVNAHVPPVAPMAPVIRARQQQDNEREGVIQVAAAPGQGNNADAALRRFLVLAMQDREDEWDSDEDEMPHAPAIRQQRNRRR